MTKLSICIPVEAGSIDPAPLVARLLVDAAADIEIVVGAPFRIADALQASAASDARLKIVTLDMPLTLPSLWRQTVAASTGDWVTLIKPGDAIETELALMVAYLERTSPDVDALAWNVFQIDENAEPGQSSSVAIPAAYQIDMFDKTPMLKSFFYWENSLQAPKMPFGLYHGAVRRSVIEAVFSLPESQDWSTPVPQYEWAAKVLLFSTEIAFCSRPISAVGVVPFTPRADWKPAGPFPFHAGLGLTGAVAEVQFHVLRELGSAWEGDAAFVRACMIDCMMETDRDAFRVKGNAYFSALQQFGDGSLAALFRPEFREARPADKRRGLHNEALLVDRFLGGARTAPEFYEVARSMLAPIELICGGATVR